MEKHLKILFRLYKRVNDKHGQPFSNKSIKVYIKFWLLKY